MDRHPLQGWHADPFGRHEQRYFSAGRPTRLVRDGRAEAYDEPPAQGAAVPASSPNGGTSEAGAGPGTTEAGAGPRTSAGHRTTSTPAVPHSRRRTGLVNIAVALIAAAAVVAFVAIAGGFSPKHGPASHPGSASPGVNLAAFVKRSAEQTLALKTADFTVKGTGQVDGTTVDLHGNGQIDLAAKTEAVTINTSESGMSVAESEIETSQALYLQVALNGHGMAQFAGGKHWVEVPLPASATYDTTQASPAWSMDVLEQQGARVVRLGTQSIGGLTCDEYAVAPSRQGMLAAAQPEWAKLGLSSSEMAVARQELETSIPPAITVWVDPTRQLVCQIDAHMQLNPSPRGGALTTNSILMVMTFTHYGVPVDIAPPAPSDTVTF